MKVKPAPGVKVRDPRTLKFIPEAGIELKEMSTYWVRRIECQDVIVVAESAPQPAPKVSKPAAGGA
jgi:hypothetical protein